MAAALLGALAAAAAAQPDLSPTVPVPPSAPRPGAAASCPPRAAPTLRVTLSDPDPRVLPAVSAAQLRVLSAMPEDTAAGATLHHLGLTLSRVEWRSDITVRSQGPPGGPVCGVPSEIRLSLVHAEHSIRLAREIPRGGCLAAEVMAHERRHVEVNRRTLRDAAEGIRIAARAWAARAEAHAADAGAAALLLQDGLTAAVEPVLARLRSLRQAGHDGIDTAEEYRRLGRACPGEQVRLGRGLRTH